MKGTSRKRTLLVSCAVILLCMTVIIGMTWALFTDTHTVKNHLKAGDLEITLERIGLEKYTLNESGYLTSNKYSETAAYWNFSNFTPKDVFDIQGNEKIVPGSEFIATMQIKNNSDAAFGYWIAIDCDDADAANALAKQLLITVYTDQNGDGIIDTEGDDAEKDESAVANGLVVGNDKNYVGTLAIGKAETFIVSVEFTDADYTYENGVLKSTNDDAQAKSVAFDLVVYAVQVPTATTP